MKPSLKTTMFNKTLETTNKTWLILTSCIPAIICDIHRHPSPKLLQLPLLVKICYCCFTIKKQAWVSWRIPPKTTWNWSSCSCLRSLQHNRDVVGNQLHRERYIQKHIVDGRNSRNLDGPLRPLQPRWSISCFWSSRGTLHPKTRWSNHYSVLHQSQETLARVRQCLTISHVFL